MRLLPIGILAYLIRVNVSFTKILSKLDNHLKNKIASKLALIQVEKFESQCNVKLVNFSVTYVSNGIDDPIFNITLENKVVMQKLIGYVKIFVAESPEDKVFKKEYLSMTVDHEKLLNGNTGRFVLRAFMENFMSSLDSEIKFPLKKVTRLVLTQISHK